MVRTIVFIAIVGAVVVGIAALLLRRGSGFFSSTYRPPVYAPLPPPPYGGPPITAQGPIDPALQQIDRGIREGTTIVRDARSLWGQLSDSWS